jgi:hypothetical protein
MPNNGAIASTMDGINTKSITIPSGYTSGGTVSLDDTIDNEVDEQTDLIAQITSALEGKAGGRSEPELQDKTVTPTTSEQVITADNGYDGLNEVTVEAIPSTYVKPTATKGATTYTPTTSNQTIAAGTYCSGAQTIKGDANLKAENIASGVSIFGVNGTHSGSGGSIETCTVTVGISEISGPSPNGVLTYNYLDKNCTYQSISFDSGREEINIEVVKNSII